MAETIHVLIVDDDADCAMTLKTGLEALPGALFTCEIASTMASAVQRLAHHDIDAAIVDLTLPDAKGTDSVAAIRAVAPEIRAVVYTGSPEMHAAAKAAGASDVLTKPTDLHAISTALQFSVAYRKSPEWRALDEALAKLGSMLDTIEKEHGHRCMD